MPMLWGRECTEDEHALWAAMEDLSDWRYGPWWAPRLAETVWRALADWELFGFWTPRYLEPVWRLACRIDRWVRWVPDERAARGIAPRFVPLEQWATPASAAAFRAAPWERLAAGHMRIVVTGSREHQGRELIERTLARASAGKRYVELIHGDCRGADRIAAQYGRSRRWKVTAMGVSAPEWDALGAAAGPLRNERMLATRPNVVVAFPLGPRRPHSGTWGCIDMAKAAGLAVECA